MSFSKKEMLYRSLMIIFAIGAFAGASYAQLNVTIQGLTPTSPPVPIPSIMPAPSGIFNVVASPTPNPNAFITKVVFYRNGVPYQTVTSPPYQIPQDELGQDTYTYRARAYESTGAWLDSSDLKLSVRTPRVMVMGQANSHLPGAPSTSRPGRLTNHTIEIRNAVDYLGALPGGGTLVFPCKLPPNPWNPNVPDGFAVYNIRETINIPENVTLQGESAEALGRCRIYWHDVSWNPNHDEDEDYDGNREDGCFENSDTREYPLRNKPMFRITGGNYRVRFKDLWLYSRSSGWNCYVRYDYDRIATEGTVGIEMNTDVLAPSGDIKDVIFENVSITNFTYGIKAVSGNASNHEISGVRIRAYRPNENFRQLYISARYAYDWDVQNLNVIGMAKDQGAVEISYAGKRSTYIGENGGLKFAFLNCNGSKDRENPPAFCVQVDKHGGLYFRQMHHEGVPTALNVRNISGNSAPNNTNPDPIILEASVATGKFEDASMKLYLIGNGILTPNAIAKGLDDARLRFSSGGLNATVVDCGDVHTDWTDVQEDEDPSDNATWDDLKMLYSHAERNRASFFAKDSFGKEYNMPHTYCPSNIDQIGGVFFDNGIMPTEAMNPADTLRQYSNVLDGFSCPSGNVANCLESLMDYEETTPNSGGAVYIPAGLYAVDRSVRIPRGAQIIGATGADGSPTATLKLDVPNVPSVSNVPLFRMDVKLLSESNQARLSSVVIRNLKLTTSDAGTTMGIALVGENDTNPNPDLRTVGVSSDIHLSGIVIEGFDRGLYAGPDFDPPHSQPMIDGISMKNMYFVDNATAVNLFSSNASNWNIMDLKMDSTRTDPVGWDQIYGGHIGFQDVSCKGPNSPGKMQDCIKLKMSNIFLNGLRKTDNVENSLTIGTNGNIFQGTKYQVPVPATLVLRNSDFSSPLNNSSKVNILGKSYITSMNNKYTNFSVGSGYEADVTRVTYCGDTYPGDSPYPVLADTHQNLWVWARTATRVACGKYPFPFDDVVTLGGETGDVPLVGNIYHDQREDFIIYRPGAPANFLIRQAGGTASQAISWGTSGDKPIIGRFFPNSRAQIGIFRESTYAQWWINDPNNGANNSVFIYGTFGDVPFVGNFLDEQSSSVSGNHDEIAVYRPIDKRFWIMNPRNNSASATFATTPHKDSVIQVGDFKGLGYDQIAQYYAGVWHITDPRAPGTLTSDSFGALPDDVPVVGRYFAPISSTINCTQIGYWRPSDQKFYVMDANSTCGGRTAILRWGSNNDFLTSAGVNLYGADDIPLAISNEYGIRRPAAYRPTRGIFDKSVANGQWWVHDPF